MSEKPDLTPRIQKKVRSLGFPLHRYDGKHEDINLHLNSLQKHQKLANPFLLVGMPLTAAGTFFLTQGTDRVISDDEPPTIAILGAVLLLGGGITLGIGTNHKNKFKFHFGRATVLYDMLYRGQ